jgi:hypothetical protein
LHDPAAADIEEDFTVAVIDIEELRAIAQMMKRSPPHTDTIPQADLRW